MANIVKKYNNPVRYVEHLKIKDTVKLLKSDADDAGYLINGNNYEVINMELDCYDGECNTCPTFGTCVSIKNERGERHYSCALTLGNAFGQPLTSVHGDNFEEIKIILKRAMF
jgi:hypothetical protein